MASPAATSHARNIINDLVTYGALSGLSRVANLLLLPVLTRYLSPEEYGAVDIVATFVAFMTSFVRLALPSALSRFLKESADARDQNRLFTTLLVFGGGVAVASWIVLIPLLPALSLLMFGDASFTRSLFLGCGIAAVTAVNSVAQMQLRMERRIAAYGATEMCETLSYFLLAAGVVAWRGLRVDGVLGAQLVAAMLGLVVSLAATRRHLVGGFDRAGLRRSLRFGMPLIPSVVISQIYAQSDRVILLTLSGLMGVGVFGAAARIAGIYQFALLAFRQAWQPYSLRLIHDQDRDGIYRRTFNYYAGVACVGGLAMMLVGPLLFSVATPPSYRQGVYVLPWLLGAAILHEASSFTKLGAVLAEKTGDIFVASSVTVPINLGLTWLFVSAFGIRAAAVGTFLSEAVLMGWLWGSTTRYTALRFDGARVLGSFGLFAIAAPLMAALPGWFHDPRVSWAGMGAIAVLSALAILGFTLDRHALAYLRRGLPSLRPKA